MSKTTAPYWNPLAEHQKHRWRWLEGLEGQIEELILSHDPATDEFTRLTRFHPWADMAAFGATVHAYTEEILIVDGRLWDEAFGMWLEPGHYASRPPEEVHGPFHSGRRSPEGAVALRAATLHRFSHQPPRQRPPGIPGPLRGIRPLRRRRFRDHHRVPRAPAPSRLGPGRSLLDAAHGMPASGAGAVWR